MGWVTFGHGLPDRELVRRGFYGTAGRGDISRATRELSRGVAVSHPVNATSAGRLEMKTARFATVVAKCGKPVPHLAWIALEQDRELKSALAANRVMTIHQIARGGKKDFGTVGFTKGPQTQILIFPKSLRRFGDRRIVAINYDLLANAAKFVPARDKPLQHAGRKDNYSRPAAVVAFPRAKSRTISSPAETARPQPPERSELPKPVERAAVIEMPPLLTWSEALAAIESIQRRMKRRRVAEATAALTELAERIRERLKPH